jgi:hypothetical protein
MNYICEKCNYTTTVKCNYEAHKLRKYSCVKLPIKCELCEGTFAHKSSLITHINNLTCQNKIKNKIINDKSIKQGVNNRINTIKNSNNNIVNNITNNINIKDFNMVCNGQEDKTALTDKCYTQILSKGFMALPDLIQTLHFSEYFPEYHTIYITDKKKKEIHIYTNKQVGWTIASTQEIIPDLIVQNHTIIKQQFKTLKKNLDEDALRRIKEFIKKCDEKDDKCMKKLSDDISDVLYINRNIAIETRKKQEVYNNLHSNDGPYKDPSYYNLSCKKDNKNDDNKDDAYDNSDDDSEDDNVKDVIGDTDDDTEDDYNDDSDDDDKIKDVRIEINNFILELNKTKNNIDLACKLIRKNLKKIQNHNAVSKRRKDFKFAQKQENFIKKKNIKNKTMESIINDIRNKVLWYDVGMDKI